MGIAYVGGGFLAVVGVLVLFARLSRPRPVARRPDAVPPPPISLADEAELWLRRRSDPSCEP